MSALNEEQRQTCHLDLVRAVNPEPVLLPTGLDLGPFLHTGIVKSPEDRGQSKTLQASLQPGPVFTSVPTVALS